MKAMATDYIVHVEIEISSIMLSMYSTITTTL